MRRAWLPSVLSALALAVAGCGSDESAEGNSSRSEVVDVSGTQPLGEMTAGSVAQLAQCRDWNRGNDAEKLATIDDIRDQVNVQNPGVQAPALTDDEAMEVFDRACEADYAQGFRLYILYARAAGYIGVLR